MNIDWRIARESSAVDVLPCICLLKAFEDLKYSLLNTHYSFVRDPPLTIGYCLFTITCCLLNPFSVVPLINYSCALKLIK